MLAAIVPGPFATLGHWAMDEGHGVGSCDAELARTGADDVGVVLFVQLLDLFVVLSVREDFADAVEFRDACNEGTRELGLVSMCVLSRWYVAVSLFVSRCRCCVPFGVGGKRLGR